MLRYTLTDSKIEIDYGLIARTTRNIPLAKIQDVTVSASILQRILGFGDQRNYQPAFVRQGKPTLLHRIMSASNGAQTRIQLLRQRISARIQRLK